jgi:hypothetical protein
MRPDNLSLIWTLAWLVFRKDSPYIAEPVSDTACRNVMYGVSLYLNTSGTSEAIGTLSLGDDNCPTNEADFVKTTLTLYTSFAGSAGAAYAQHVSPFRRMARKSRR